jgi:hypothetical protein
MFYFIILTRLEFPSLSSQSKSSIMKDQSPLNRQKSQGARLRLTSAALANQSGKAKAEAANKQTGIVADIYSHFWSLDLCILTIFICRGNGLPGLV